RLRETARLPWPQRRAAIDAVEADAADAPEPTLQFDVRKVALLCQEARAFGRSAVAAVAAERYRLRPGARPEAPAALGPERPPEGPADPFDGQPLRYRRWPDGVAIYSVGADTSDDNGKLAEGYPPAAGTDLGFRLWDVPHRRQPPPASDPAGTPAHQESRP